jgi:hypothetical protein
MSTPRFPSRPSAFCVGLALLVQLAMVSVAQAQTQASCTFKFFQFTRFQPLNQPTGINDWETVVGVSGNLGFIRYAGGGFTHYSVPNASQTYFSDRNDHGISIGGYFTSGSQIQKGFMIDKSGSFTSIVHPKAVFGTGVARINRWNTIVGWYMDSQNIARGFKRYSNGSFVALDFPGGQGTFASGLNDNGMIVGGSGMHGFIYYKGQWATLDFPNAVMTTLVDISNAGVIIGNAELPNQFTTTGFLYRNGVFKIISVPNVRTTEVTAISSKSGLITGDTRDFNGNPQGFIAKCN